MLASIQHFASQSQASVFLLSLEMCLSNHEILILGVGILVYAFYSLWVKKKKEEKKSETPCPPQWGTMTQKLKTSSVVNPEFKRSPFKAWRRSRV